jgi:sec-independent protein translocase protein TatC
MAEDLVERARNAVTERAELPGMSLIEHLEELRRRLIHSAIYLVIGFFVAYGFHDRLTDLLEKPLNTALARHHPIEPFNFSLKLSFIAGAIMASPFVLYQVWLFISPGLYRHEKRYVWPFMGATITLFLAGAFFGYHYVYPGALDFLLGYGKQFTPMVTINEYCDLFMTVILGLGIVFELPILVMFLALFGLVTPRWLWKNIRYAILVIFIIAAIITPTPDILTMCVFAAPMVGLYIISIAVAYVVHPSRRDRKKKEAVS